MSTKKQRSSLLLAALLCLSHPAMALELNEQFPKSNDPIESPFGFSKNNDELKLEAIISKSHSTGNGKIDKAWLRHFENGNIEMFQGHLAKAENHFLESIRQLKKKNIKDERLLKSRIRLAQTFLKEGKTLDARDTFKLAIKTAEEIDKELSQEVANAFNGLAKLYQLDGKYKKSETYIKKALKLSKEVSGEDSLGVSENLLDLAELYKEQRLYDSAEPIYKLSLKKLDNATGIPDLTKTHFLDKTGMFFHEQGKMPEANKLFELSLNLKNKYTTLYSPVDARKRGLVTYRCENGVPNAARVFTRGAEVEYLKVKDAIAVATLTPQVYASDWYLLKAEVTLQNQGKKAITACAELPSLTLKGRSVKQLSPLDSDAISRELGRRGRRLYSRLLHSADFAYTINNIGFGTGAVTRFSGPFGTRTWATAGGWVNISPNWGARIQARNAAIAALGNAYTQGSSVLRTKPSPMTLNPGEAATFQVFFPYKKFDKGTLRFLVGNAVLEFPFTKKSG